MPVAEVGELNTLENEDQIVVVEGNEVHVVQKDEDLKIALAQSKSKENKRKFDPDSNQVIGTKKRKYGRVKISEDIPAIK